jgi:hypothetical protein
VVVAEGGGKQMTREKPMKSKSFTFTGRNTILTALAIVLLCAPAFCWSNQAASPAAPAQKGFATAKEAAAALIQAAGTFDLPALKELLGPEGEDLVASSDPVQDKNNALAFASLAREKQSVAIDPKNSSRAILSVGNQDWPMPIPLVKRAGKWYFDSKAGREEVLFRRIGDNELGAIQICLGFVEAQREYASVPRGDSKTNQYAQRIISTPGKQDGLYWENADGTPGGPISKVIAKAIEEGYSVDKTTAYHGYYFKVLKGQGPAAPLGELDYVIKGIMIGGFALVAVPADYRVTGVQTFLVSNDGIVYQKDLGPDSINLVKQMERYNPDKTWTRTGER